MPWAFEGIQAIRPAVDVRQLPMMDGLGEGRTLAEGGTGGSGASFKPLAPQLTKVKVLTVAIGLPAQLPRRLRVPGPHPRSNCVAHLKQNVRSSASRIPVPTLVELESCVRFLPYRSFPRCLTRSLVP